MQIKHTQRKKRPNHYADYNYSFELEKILNEILATGQNDKQTQCSVSRISMPFTNACPNGGQLREVAGRD